MDALLIKQTFTTKELQLLDGEFNKRKKSTSTSWLLWVFLGGLGGHRYYLGKIGTAILMTITLGCFGLWTLIDAFLLSGNIRKANEQIEMEIIEKIQTMRAARNNDQVAATIS